VTVPNHILLIAIDWKHRYGASSLELALNRVDAHLELEEIEEARAWNQVATVLARALLRPDDVQQTPVQPTPL
jgi:hypothetical protein